MADIAGALDGALRARYRVTEVRTPATSRRGLIARMNQLEKAHATKGDRPGQAATRAATAAGISPRTWREWRAGRRTPSPRLLAKLTDAHRAKITIPGLRRELKRAGVPTQVAVSAVVRWNGYYNAQPYRRVKFGPGGVFEVMRATIRAWATQGPEEAAAAFQHGLSTVHGVPQEPDGSPGIQFEGENVEVDFL